MLQPSGGIYRLQTQETPMPLTSQRPKTAPARRRRRWVLRFTAAFVVSVLVGSAGRQAWCGGGWARSTAASWLA